MQAHGIVSERSGQGAAAPVAAETASTIGPLEQAVAEAPDPAAKVRAMTALSTELARTGLPKRAQELAREAQQLARTLDDRRLQAEAIHAVARCHFYLADFVPALEMLLEAASAYQEAGDIAGAATSLSGVGLCQLRIGAAEEAIASLLRALESAQDLGHFVLEINIHNSLGSAYCTVGRIEDAERHITTGIRLAKNAGNANLLTKLLQNRSLLSKKRGELKAADDEAAARFDWEEGLGHAEEALALARELGNRYDEAHCLGQCGTMLRLVGRREDARLSLEKTLVLGRELDEPLVQAEALLELGRLRITESELERARAALEQAIGLAGRINARWILAEACESLSGLHERAGEHGAALALYKRFHAVREHELATSRQHAARAGQLWFDFQRATRQAIRYREEAKLFAEQSQQDPLTGLLNRRGLDDRIGALVAASEINAVPLTIALIDVDRFKVINDSFSHATGDIVLQRIAQAIRAHCRANDLPVRYGGDEFLVVLAGADLATGERVLRRIKAAVDAMPWQDHATGLTVTLSIGVAGRAPGATIAATIGAADRALYAAKSSGRDRIVRDVGAD